MWVTIHTRLQEVCIDLWPTMEDCRALVAEAEIDSSRMMFGEPPALRWESIILQCDRQRSLNQLAPVLLSRYPNNPLLQQVVQPWIRGNPKETTMKRSPSADAPTITTIQPAEAVKPIEAVVYVPLEEAQDQEDMVAVRVPKAYAEAATTALTATIHSLRKTIAAHEKDLQELRDWRAAISNLSREQVAMSTGANEVQKVRG